MLVKVHDDSQIVIPKEIIDKLNLQISDGDEVEILEKNGAIHILPVNDYPKLEYTDEYVKQIEKESKELKSSRTYTFEELCEVLGV